MYCDPQQIHTMSFTRIIEHVVSLEINLKNRFAFHGPSIPVMRPEFLPGWCWAQTRAHELGELEHRRDMEWYATQPPSQASRRWHMLHDVSVCAMLRIRADRAKSMYHSYVFVLNGERLLNVE